MDTQETQKTTLPETQMENFPGTPRETSPGTPKMPITPRSSTTRYINISPPPMDSSCSLSKSYLSSLSNSVTPERLTIKTRIVQNIRNVPKADK